MVMFVVEENHLKVSKAALYLGISANTLRKYTDEGRVRAKRLPGGDRLYDKAELDAFAASFPAAVEAATFRGRKNGNGSS